MSRYRPPRLPRTAVITAEGIRLMQQELDFLWKQERPVVTQAVSDAAKNGDRSENGDYIYGKQRLRQIDSRVRFLRKRIDSLRVIDTTPDDTERIFFGAWVRLVDEEDNPQFHRIVGPDEFDRQTVYISVDSPVAKALMGKAVDDEISVQTPTGEKTWWVDAVAYTGELAPADWRHNDEESET